MREIMSVLLTSTMFYHYFESTKSLQCFPVLTSSLVKYNSKGQYISSKCKKIPWMKDRLQWGHFSYWHQRNYRSGRQQQQKKINSTLIKVLNETVTHELQICKKIWLLYLFSPILPLSIYHPYYSKFCSI